MHILTVLCRRFVFKVSPLCLSAVMSTSNKYDTCKYDKPLVTRTDAAKVAKLYFPFATVDEKSIKEMDSYDDRNFYIEGVLDDKSGRKRKQFTLKVTNRKESEDTEMLVAQNDFMLHLRAGGFAVPEPVQARNGEYIVLHSVAHHKKDEELKYAVRLLTYLTGQLLVEVTQTPSLFFELGKTIGKMSIHLNDFPRHSALDNREYRWNLGTSLLTCRKYVHAISDKPQRQLVTEVMDEFESRALPVLKTLDMDYIHGDLNDYNILLSEPDRAGQRHVSGILDYGDIVLSYRVVDIAIAMAYATIGKEDGLRVASRHILAGYQEIHPLSNKELDILYYLVAGRLCQTCVFGSYYYSLDPTNDYLLVSAVPGWKALEDVWSQPKDDIIRMFRDVCKTS